MSQGLPAGRLKKRPEFLKVAASGRKWVGPGVIVQHRPADEGQPNCRIGFTVSRKVGNAVQRNRARRRLRAATAEILKQTNIPPCDLVMIGRVSTLDRPYVDLCRDVNAALRRLAGATS